MHVCVGVGGGGNGLENICNASVLKAWLSVEKIRVEEHTYCIYRLTAYSIIVTTMYVIYVFIILAKISRPHEYEHIGACMISHHRAKVPHFALIIEEL